MREEISLRELNRTIRRYLLYIVLAMIIGVGFSVGYMEIMVTPQYRSESELIVSQQTEQGEQYSQIQMNIQLITTYQSIITGSAVLNQASENLEGEYSVSTLRNAIEVSQPENSQLFYVSATMESPEAAQAVVAEVIAAFDTVIQRVYPNTQVNIAVLSPPALNKSKVSPSLTVYIFIGLILGLAVSVTYILFNELMDTRVRDDSYFEKLDLINVGNIYELSNREFKDASFEGAIEVGRKEGDSDV